MAPEGITNSRHFDHDDDILIWSTSEQARLRALSLFLVRSIVKGYGGEVTVDLATDTINIDVPKEKEIACVQEIEEKVGAMYC
jgi:hypothetical protein